jgi:protein-S-isoprenylcysteine O-methyltransferase Ste14
LLYNYSQLIIAWLLFGLIHSLLAADLIKDPAKRLLKQGYRYYRFSYSILATVSLLAVLYYHFNCTKVLLWQPSLIQLVVAGILVIAGLIIMLLCTKKYFLDLSGIDAILGNKRAPVLQLDGMHQFVRHPLYFGTLLFVWALFFYYPYSNNLVSCICITLYTVIGTWFEEKKLVIEYGNAYQEYQKRVAALVPGLI